MRKTENKELKIKLSIPCTLVDKQLGFNIT